MSEFEETVLLAHKILNRPYADPDDELAMLSRQFLRLLEVVDSKHKCNDDMEKAMFKAQDRCQRLEEALRNLLKSADASWEEDGVWGHDWPEACLAARAELLSQRSGK